MKRQVNKHFYVCNVSSITCLSCGNEYNDESWKYHDGTCMTIDAERRRTFGKFYKEKKNKGNLFKIGRKVQAFFKSEWYSGILQSVNKVGEWKIKLDYINKILNLKQHCIRKTRGKSAQHKLELFHENKFEKSSEKDKDLSLFQVKTTSLERENILFRKKSRKKLKKDIITLKQLKVKIKEITRNYKEKNLSIKKLLRDIQKKIGKKTLIIS